MIDLIEQLEDSLQSRNYLLSLFTALSVPEIACALNSQNGKGDGGKYAIWFNHWIRPKNGAAVSELWFRKSGRILEGDEPGSLTGEACYQLRCNMLHRGTIQARGGEKYVVSRDPNPFDKIPKNGGWEVSRILFHEPNPDSGSVVDENYLGDVLVLSLEVFCMQIILGTRDWFQQAEKDDFVRQNIQHYLRREIIEGIPVIG